MSQKPNVNKDSATFSKFSYKPSKEVDVFNSSIAEEMYEKNENPKNSFDVNASNKNLKR